jgi:lysophospholipase L1-like esterase
MLQTTMSAGVVTSMKSHTRVILGDSIVKNIRHINDCNVISLSGSTFDDLSNLIAKYPEIISKASSILIHCGTNHITVDSPGTVLTKFCILTNLIIAINSDCKILISSILPRPRDDSTFGDKVKDVNKLLKLECSKKKFSFLMTNKLFLKHGKPIESYFYDGLHLSTSGNMRLRQMFSQRLATLGNKPTMQTCDYCYLKRHQWSKL